MKWKRHFLGTESYLSASGESGDEGDVTVYSIKFTKASCSKEKLLYKIQAQNSLP